jgi:hypothetical protein
VQKLFETEFEIGKREFYGTVDFIGKVEYTLGIGLT